MAVRYFRYLFDLIFQYAEVEVQVCVHPDAAPVFIGKAQVGVVQGIYLLDDDDAAKCKSDTDYQLNDNRDFAECVVIAFSDYRVDCPAPENG
jgi:hypothetical protein